MEVKSTNVIFGRAGLTAAAIILFLAAGCLFVITALVEVPLPIRVICAGLAIVLTVYAFVLGGRWSELDLSTATVSRIYGPWGMIRFKVALSEFVGVQRIVRAQGEVPPDYFVDVILRRGDEYSKFVFATFGSFGNAEDASRNEPSLHLAKQIAALSGLPFEDSSPSSSAAPSKYSGTDHK